MTTPCHIRPLARRSALTLAALGLMGLALPAAAQGSYPDKPVRIIVGFPAGTGPDIVARLVAQKLSEGWKNVGVVVDNKPGAAGLIAASELARAPADGYTLLLAETGMLSIAPSTYNRLPYDPVKDFLPVSQVVSTDFVLLVNPQKVPAKNVKEYAAWSQKQKGLFMATFGAGTLGHFGAYRFGDAIGQKPEAVHYRNTADALGGLFSGDVSGVFATIGLAAANIKAGKLVALGSTGSTRSPSLPEVPTIVEQGYPDLAFSAWFGIVAPANTPGAIVDKLNADIVRAVQSADGKQKLLDAGFRPTGTSAAEFRQIIAADTVTWRKAVQATGFKAD
ncbi:tripartite tricarboxylate transporter substrate-binding protein [Xenophilus arseniciresistens]|uniref:Tripartite tricarboxylate transporter substrate-binding protein n=1 Tax=Xenophilus arseniciresistens TaxID=1283306 RepID=A0AAE3T203_9BURK|nr:tripartite tricarboxylate transporter substrate-binding protein [Xenophilus arseniciresistens]MDA7419180.1 tripartite tricarboxylate transporter substrate-binding protein [Xenophilus arseniciresistens]